MTLQTQHSVTLSPAAMSLGNCRNGFNPGCDSLYFSACSPTIQQATNARERGRVRQKVLEKTEKNRLLLKNYNTA